MRSLLKKKKYLCSKENKEKNKKMFQIVKKNSRKYFHPSHTTTMGSHFHSNESENANCRWCCFCYLQCVWYEVWVFKNVIWNMRRWHSADEEYFVYNRRRNQTIKYFDIKKKEILKIQECMVGIVWQLGVRVYF